MTDNKILELAEKYLKRGGIRDDGSTSEYYATTKYIIVFARAIYEEGYDDGCFRATGGQ